MAQKKGVEPYLEDTQESYKFHLDKITLFTGIAFIAICELFFYFLSAKTSVDFTIGQIIFGLVAGISLTLFLLWTRFIMASNKYLGGFISLTGILATTYALTRKFQGTYTTTFMVIGIVIALAYTIYYFIKFSNK